MRTATGRKTLGETAADEIDALGDLLGRAALRCYSGDLAAASGAVEEALGRLLAIRKPLRRAVMARRAAALDVQAEVREVGGVPTVCKGRLGR